MPYYCINKNSTNNPGCHHEVHTHEHAETLRIRDKINLGWCANEVEAVQKGKLYYTDADGCALCCPRVHKG